MRRYDPGEDAPIRPSSLRLWRATVFGSDNLLRLFTQ